MAQDLQIQHTIICTATVEEALALIAAQSLSGITVRCPDRGGQCQLTCDELIRRVAEYGRAPDQITLGEVFNYDYSDGVKRACRT